MYRILNENRHKAISRLFGCVQAQITLRNACVVNTEEGVLRVQVAAKLKEV